MIILEGNDASGKSQLASLLSHRLNWPVQSSEGPPKSEQEIVDRMLRYSTYPDAVIFDRHPAISQQVYAAARGDAHGVRIATEAFNMLLDRSPLIIACRPPYQAKHHVKEHDTPEHLALLDDKATMIDEAYRDLLTDRLVSAARHNEFNLTDATLLHYTWDNLDDIVRACDYHAMGDDNSWRRCLDVGYVRLVNMMGNEGSIVLAARTSYNRRTLSDEQRERDRHLMSYLRAHHHTTPFEHVTLTFEVKAPLAVFRQWHRHRTQSYNEMSQRYTRAIPQIYVPCYHMIGQQSTHDKQQRDPNATPPSLDSLREYLACVRRAHDTYEALSSAGWPRELARGVLPTHIYSRMWATMNLHNFLAFVEKRVKAQPEISTYAFAMLDIVASRLPNVVIDFIRSSEAFQSFDENARRSMIENIERDYLPIRG